MKQKTKRFFASALIACLLGAATLPAAAASAVQEISCSDSQEEAAPIPLKQKTKRFFASALIACLLGAATLPAAAASAVQEISCSDSQEEAAPSIRSMPKQPAQQKSR